MTGLNYDKGCKRCTLHLSCKSVCVPGDGRPGDGMDAKILFLGIAPGADEDLLNLPFQGRSGKLLHAAIKECLPGYDYRIENVVRCRPPDNRDPTKLEIEACLPYLEKIVTEMPNLEYIIPLGEIPIRVCGLKGGVKELSGIPQTVVLFGKNLGVYSLAHPAYVLRDQRYLSTWESHFHGLKRLLEQKNSGSQPTISNDSLQDVLSSAAASGTRIALDLETTDLISKRGSILSWSVSDGTKTFGEGISEPSSLVRLVEYLLTQAEGHGTTVQGAFFEGSWFRNLLGLRNKLPPDVNGKCKKIITRDTLLMAHRVDPGQPADLGSLCARYLSQHSGYKVNTISEIREAYKVSPSDLLSRNREDSLVTAKLGTVLESRLPPGVTQELLEEDVDLALAVQEISEKGLVLDEEEMVRQRSTAETSQADTSKDARLLLGKDINLGSPQQVGAALSELGATLSTTDKGNAQTGEVELRSLRQVTQDNRVKDLVDYVLKFREAGKILSTYIKGYSTRSVGYSKHGSPNERRLYSRLIWPGTVSWRLSSSDPNLQNVPRGAFRKVFTAPRDHLLMECDLAQAELRIIAALSQDPVLFPLFMAGGDPHNLMVQKIGLSNPHFLTLPPREQRNRAKVTNFGLGYGAGPGTLWEQFAKDGVFLPMAECRLYHRTFWQTYQGFELFLKGQMDILRSGGRVYSPTGGYSWTWQDLLILHPDDPEGALRAAFNCTIQSVPPRITLRLAYHLLELGIEVVLQTHDGLLMYVPNGSEHDVAKVVTEIIRELTSEVWLKGLPMPVDIKCGPNWFDLKPLEKKI